MDKVSALFSNDMVVAESSQAAQTLYDQSRFGELKEGKFQYSLVEALFLLEKDRMINLLKKLARKALGFGLDIVYLGT